MTTAVGKVAFLTASEGIEQAELTEPWKAVEAAGWQPVLVADGSGAVQAYNHLDKADQFPIDVPLGDANAGDYVALVLPGGVANGDQVRMQPTAVEFVRQLAHDSRPIAVICHGGWVLIEAGIVPGRTLTSWPSLATDYRNAGADWVDKTVVVDPGNPTIISSRKPADLAEFCRALTDTLAIG